MPQGNLSETFILTVQAYYDSSYTQFYSQDNALVTYNLIDRAASAWSMLAMDNFDNTTQNSWVGVGSLWSEPAVTGELYRSWPNSLKIETFMLFTESGIGRTFKINSSYTEAYLIAAIKN